VTEVQIRGRGVKPCFDAQGPIEGKPGPELLGFGELIGSARNQRHGIFEIGHQGLFC
jgi:hypothetical protein